MNALSNKCLRMKLFRFALETKNKQRRLNIKKKKNQENKNNKKPPQNRTTEKEETLNEGY